MSFEHLVIPVLGLLIPIIAILAHHLLKAHIERQRHLTIREFVRAGQPVPPELLAEVAEPDGLRGRNGVAQPNRLMLSAVVNGAVGLGLMGMFFVINPGGWLWSIGLIPLCLGLGLALVWVMTRKPPSAP
jgi:hypothetical protein